MNLNDIDIKLTERSNPQAINLGFVTARRYFPKLFLASILATLPWLVIACGIAYYFESFAWGSLALWWGKPYIDRVILLNGSRLIFREKISFRDIISSLASAFKNGLWLNLSFYRLSTSRCVTIPIMALEQLSGRDYARRRKIILRASRSIRSVTLGLLHFDTFLYLSLIFVILMMVPDDINPIAQGLYMLLKTQDFTWLYWVALPIQALSSALIEVFYVMVGFMLYLNSRIKTEGWHIDIGFKQIAERLTHNKNKSKNRNVVLTLFIATLLVLSTTPKIATAQSAQDVIYDTQNLINEIQNERKKEKNHQKYESRFIIDSEKNRTLMREMLLANDPFEVKGEWKANDTDSTAENNKKSSSLDNDFNMPELGGLVKAILIALGVAFVIWLYFHRDKLSGLFQGKTKVQVDARPSVMFGLDIRKESLPNDIPSEAMRLFNQGKILAALSLLYRGSLTVLIHDFDLDIKESDTEGDCLRNAKSRLSQIPFGYFSDLTQAWQSAVYAHRRPEDAQIEQLIKLYNGAFKTCQPLENSEARENQKNSTVKIRDFGGDNE